MKSKGADAGKHSSPDTAHQASPLPDPAAQSQFEPVHASSFPTVRLQRSKLITLGMNEAHIDIFRSLRTQLLGVFDSQESLWLGISSVHPEEGKTFISANLAAVIALSQYRSVLLVDLDLRNPSLINHIDGHPPTSLVDYLSGQCGIMDCIYDTDVSGLSVLPASGRIRNSSEAIGSPYLYDGLQHLRRSLPDRLLIFDMPPLLVGDDALVITKIVDALLMVVEEGRTTPGELQRCLGLVPKEKFAGLVMNKSRTANLFQYGLNYAE